MSGRWFGVSGSRRLPASWSASVASAVAAARGAGFGVSVGCCPSGADAFARAACPSARVFRAASRRASALVARSVSFVRFLASVPGSVLAVWVVSPCPSVVVPRSSWASGGGSGSWASAALAVGLGVPVFLFWAGSGVPVLPAWPGGRWVPVSAAGSALAGSFRWVRSASAVRPSFQEGDTSQ